MIHDARGPELRPVLEIAIRLAMIFLIVGWCLYILAPFVGIVVWAIIIAIATHSPYERLSGLLGGRRTLAAVLFVLISLSALILPAVLLSETLVNGAQGFAANLASGEFSIPPPPEKVAGWPIIGDRVYEMWTLANQNLSAAASKLEPQLEAVSRWLLGAAGSAGVAMLELAASLVLGGVFLARSSRRMAALDRFASRIAGARGPEFAALAQATVSSVVQGIVGVAVIQATLAGIGFIVADLPAAGLWALIVLIAAVVQLPVFLVVIPPILLVYSAQSTGVTAAFAIWCLIVSALDNILKPILFGRGVKVPTIVIFLGAIGGMLTMGIVGLFLGAVVLTLGYELFVAWLDADDDGAALAETG
jgi:predicted PurR-regulated permease PerM